MAKYEPGIQTRKKILNTCKKLFYEKGYEETTYDDICREGQVNRGLIHYHFNGKYNIGRQIFSDFLMDSNHMVDSIVARDYGDTLGQCLAALDIRTYLNLIFADEHVKRFYYEISRTTKFTAGHTDLGESFHRRYIDAFNLDLPEIEVKFMTAAVMGMSSSLHIMYMHGYLNATQEEYIDYRIRFFYALMGIKRERIEEIVEESRRIHAGFNLGVKKYFKLYTVK